MKKIILLLSITAIGLGVAALYWVEEEKISSVVVNDQPPVIQEGVIRLTDQQIKDHAIVILKASAGQLKLSLSTRGKIVLHPDQLIHVLPNISGMVKEAHKNIGDTVEKDEIIAVLESREMADSKANYLAAVERAKLAQALYDREARLYRKKITPEQDVLNASSAYEEAKIQVELAKQKLYAFGLKQLDVETLKNPDLRYYEIRSPINGVVVNRDLSKGEYIDTTTPIYEIADLNPVWVEIGIYSKDLDKVKPGQVVQVSSPTENISSSAKLVFISPIIEEDTINAKAVAELSNEEKIWHPGTFVKAHISIGKAFAPVVIPKAAVQQIDNESVVFIRTSDGFEKRPVKLGQEDRTYVEIQSGLQQGEHYAGTQTFLLKAELGKSPND